MRAVLLDTNAYAAFMLGAAEVVDVVAHAEKLFLTSIVVGLRRKGQPIPTNDLRIAANAWKTSCPNARRLTPTLPPPPAAPAPARSARPRRRSERRHCPSGG